VEPGLDGTLAKLLDQFGSILAKESGKDSFRCSWAFRVFLLAIGEVYINSFAVTGAGR